MEAMFSKNNKGFTLIELTVVIVVIGIISSIVFVGMNQWQKSTAVTVVKSDLSGASSSMKNYLNFNNFYPESIPSNFSKSDDITLSGGSIDGGKTFCIDGSNSKHSGTQYYVDSSSESAQLGSCPPTSTTIFRLSIVGDSTGKVVITDGMIVKEYIKSDPNDDMWWNIPFKYYTSDGHKELTSVVAVPDNPADVAGLRWHDWWQCPMATGLSLQTGAINNLRTDDTFRVNFGSHTFVPQKAC